MPAISTATPKRVTEMDALVAYLQMLGTLVDFKLYDDKPTFVRTHDLQILPRIRADRRPPLLRALFLGVAIYALWPRNRARFDAAARMPLNDGD